MAYSLEFFGGEYIDCGSNSELAVHIGNGFTLEGWFYYDGSDNANPLFHKKSRNGVGDTELEYMFSVGTSDWYGISDEILFAQCGNDASIDNVMNKNAWNYVAVTVDTTSSTNNVKFYVNDSFIDSKSVPIDKTDRGYSLSIGAHWTADGSTDKHLIGKMDELRIWNYIRSESELMNNKNKSLTGNETGLVAYWKLNEGSGDTVYDSANNNDGTIHGSYSWSTDSAPLISIGQFSVSGYMKNIYAEYNRNVKANRNYNNYINKVTGDYNRSLVGKREFNITGFTNQIHGNYERNIKVYRNYNNYINTSVGDFIKTVKVNKNFNNYINNIKANNNLIRKAFRKIQGYINKINYTIKLKGRKALIAKDLIYKKASLNKTVELKASLEKQTELNAKIDKQTFLNAKVKR